MKRTLDISEEIQLDLEKFIGRCVAILGIRGSGKTNTSAVLLEELLRFKYPLTIVDIDGEYWGLKEQYEILVVGKSKNVDIEVDVEHAGQIAEVSISKNIPVILDLSGFLLEDMYKFLLDYFKEIWDLAGKFRKPYEIVLEESHEFIPQGIRTDLKEILIKIALRGRKRGLGAIILSQRSARVDKDVLTQAEILFLHKVVHPADMRVYKEILPLSSKEVSKLVMNLDVGDCIYFFEENCKPIHIRLRETFHAGFTPSLKTVEIPKLKAISDEILKSIKKITESELKKKSKIERLEKEIIEFEAKLSEREKKIQKLEEDLETLGRISVEVKQPEVPRIAQISKAVIEQLVATGVVNKENLNQSKIKDIETAVGKEKNLIKYEELPYDVKRHIERILSRIKKLPKPTREMLAFLVNRYPSAYTYSQIADWTKYSEHTLYKNPPAELLKMKLMTRTRKGDGYHYSANLKDFVKNEFTIYYPKINKYEFQIIYEFLKKKIEQ
jgi:hypothetical protein